MAKKAERGLEESVSNLVDVSAKLEQDQMETGVDEKEWVCVLPSFWSHLFISLLFSSASTLVIF